MNNVNWLCGIMQLYNYKFLNEIYKTFLYTRAQNLKIYKVKINKDSKFSFIKYIVWI